MNSGPVRVRGWKFGLAVAPITAASLVAAPATAQDQAASQAPSEELTEVVVTGSRIRTPNVESAVPVVSITADAITSTGNVALGDLVNEQPSLRSTFNQANSTRFVGTAGVNFLDLRGLGEDRTLVLQNGRRHVAAQSGSFEVDVNTIPIELVERVDIVTGGASAIYGSDAVAGVVNFVLKDNFEGLRGRLQGGVSGEGDRESFVAALTAGTNFSEERGNVAVSIEYTRQEQLEVTDRPRQTGVFDGRTQYQIFENPTGETGGTDGIADRQLLGNVRSLGLSEGGTFIASSGTTSAIGTCATAAGCIGPVATGVPRVYRFRPDGSLVEADYGTDVRLQTGRGTGNQIGGDGSTLRRYGQLQPFVERYGINLLSHFDVSEALTPFIEAKYVRYDIFQQSSPTFASGGTQTGTVAAQTAFATLANSTGIPIFLDNAFLQPAAAELIRSALPAGQVAFRLQRNNLDFGSREETGHRDTARVVLGVRGNFNEDWNYEFSANYGDFERVLTSDNNRIQQRFRLATDAVRNAAGQIVCRSQLPGVVTPTPPIAGDAAALASDIAACVPINLFGEGAPSPAALAYINADTESLQKHEQRVVTGYVTGDFSQLFELPAGPVAFALGGEWREEDGFRDYGELVTSGRTFLTAISRSRPPEAFEVKEGFLELQIPLLRELPFSEELSLQGAARYADYRGATGGVLAWNAGVSWSPVEDVRFRVSRAVALRAPTQFDLYAELGQNFQSVTDPCDVNNINNGTATRVANCRAAGIPAGFINAPARAATISISQGGNRLLTEEQSKSWTIGAVLQPRFAPGLSISVDYYDITIEDAIGLLTTQQILDNCYDAPTLANSFCPQIRREPGTNFFSTTGPEFGVVRGSINFAAATARGVDFQIGYGRDLGIGRLNLRLVGTKALERNDYTFPEDPSRPDQLLLEVGDPELRGIWNIDYQFGAWKIGYEGRYISKQAVASVTLGGGIEDIRTVGGRPPTNPDFAADEFLPSVTYHDLRIGYDFRESATFYLGVDNVTDKLPPAGLLGNGSVYEADAIFDNIGRYFYAGATFRF